jgi:AraC-like DNA-binding protein
VGLLSTGLRVVVMSQKNMIKCLSEIITDDFLHQLAPIVNSVHYHAADPQWASPFFNRVMIDFDIWYIAEGKGQVMLNGEWVNFKKNDLLVIKPGEKYQAEKTDAEEPFVIYAVHLEPFPFGPTGDRANLAKLCPRIINTGNCQEIIDVFENLFNEWHRKRSLSNLVCRRFALELFEKIFEFSDSRNAPATLPALTLLNLMKARTFIKEHVTDPVYVEEMAAQSGWSVSHFSRLFKKHFGVSPLDYQIDLRLDAALLLLSKGDSVTKAATESGFSSIHYFSRLFKNRKGVSPSIYLKKHNLFLK